MNLQKLAGIPFWLPSRCSCFLCHCFGSTEEDDDSDEDGDVEHHEDEDRQVEQVE